MRRNGSGVGNKCRVSSYYSAQPFEDEKGFGQVGATSLDVGSSRTSFGSDHSSPFTI